MPGWLQPRLLTDMLHDETLRDKMRSRLADAKDLRELISDHKRKLISRIRKASRAKSPSRKTN